VIGRHPRVACVVLVACLVLSACSRTRPETAPAASLPDWSGIWVAADTEIDISGYPTPDSAAGMALDLLDNAAAPWTAERRQWLQAELPKIMARDATRRAEGWGYPLMMEGVPPMQFLVTPQETVILNFYRDLRHIYTDGRPLPAAEDLWPTPWGTSVGHWEGDTLVMETVAVRMGSVFPLPLPPLTGDARFVERIRRAGPDRMEVTMTIEDPAVLTGPWNVKFAYRRAAEIDRLIHDVSENDRSTVEGDSLTIAPPR
jgi:hypothetical protein